MRPNDIDSVEDDQREREQRCRRLLWLAWFGGRRAAPAVARIPNDESVPGDKPADDPVIPPRVGRLNADQQEDRLRWISKGLDQESHPVRVYSKPRAHGNTVGQWT